MASDNAMKQTETEESRPAATQQQQQQQHIRPRIQRKSPKATKPEDKKNTNGADVEATRKKMESWMGLGRTSQNNNKSDQQSTSTAKNNTIVSKSTIIQSDPPGKQIPEPQTKPTGILRTPKYSSKPTKSQAVVVESAATPTIIPGVNTIISSTPTTQVPSPPTIVDDSHSHSLSKPSTKSSLICKDVVVERDPTIATTKRKSFRKSIQTNNAATNHASIEGYIPTSTTTNAPTKSKTTPEKTTPARDTETDDSTNSSNKDENDPLIIDSLEGLMRAAGQPMPANPNRITKDTQMVEANICFSVMTQDQYETKLPNLKEEQERERQEHLEKFMGKQDIFGDDDDETLEGALEENSDDDDDEDDDAIMELLLASDLDDSDKEDERPMQVKAFSLLWDALTNWMTHETVVWMTNLRDAHDGSTTASSDQAVDREWTPMVDQSDIGTSRCAGVLAMLRLYIPQCMEELGHPLESRRRAEKRLNDLMRTFDYSRENPKLSANHWKAMACVLLDAVLIETRKSKSAPPPSVAKMGMSQAEFEYLSRKAVLIFE